MSEIKERMMQDLKEAMKKGDQFRRDALRFLHAAIKQVEIDQRKELDDNDIIGILKGAYKQREDALESYIKAEREDLIQKEQKEMDIILSYLPKQLSDEELREAVSQIITEVDAQSIKDLGKVMNAAKRLSQVADGKRVSAVAKALLSCQ